MPQSALDLASQLGFLWPGQGLDLQIQRGAPAGDVLGGQAARAAQS